MKLKKYLNTLKGEELDDFAKRCGTSVAYLKKVAGGFGGAKAGESLAINIERESDGKVCCEDMRKDVDWAFLRGTSAT